MDQGSPGHKLEDNPVLSELDWDEADLDEELHKAGGGEQAHGTLGPTIDNREDSVELTTS